ncbi:cellulose binding domain-containing protein [Luedemannella flava]
MTPTTAPPPTSAPPTTTRPTICTPPLPCPTSPTPTGPDTSAPTTPTNLTYSLSGTTLTLNWVASTDNVGVTAYYVDEQTSDYVLRRTVTAPATTLTITISYPADQHSYWVYARDAAGNVSARSNVVTFGTPPACPPPSSCSGPPTSRPPTSRPPTSAPPTSVVPTTPAPATCAVKWEPNSWSTGFTINVTLTNRGTATVNGWTLTWTWPGNQQVTGYWSSVITQSGTAVTARNAAWNATIAPGGSTTFGFQGTYSGTNARPAAFSLNGVACAVS